MPDSATRAIRRFCLTCQGEDAEAVSACSDCDCILYEYRLKEPADTKALRPVRAIRLYCFACAGNRKDIRDCELKEQCKLWSFRFGVYPATFKRILARRRSHRGLLLLPGL